MMDASCLFPLLLGLWWGRSNRIHVSAVVHSFLREIEIVTFRIVGAEGSEGAIGRPFENRDIGILFLDARDRLFDVVDIDPKVMQPRHVTRFPPDNRNTDIAVADTHRVIRSNRFLFFSRSRLGPFHAEDGLVKLGLADEVFTDNGSVLDSA